MNKHTKFFSIMFLLINLLFLNIAVANAADGKWEVVGKTGFILPWARPAIALSSNSTPYVAYIDNSTMKPLVKKYNGNMWILVGDNNISNKGSSDIAMTIDANDNLFVVYGEYDQGYKLSVVKMLKNSTSWTRVGLAGFSDGAVNNARTISITTDKSGVPYVAYMDTAHENKATVKKYNVTGNSWDTVGSEGFSATEASNITIAVDGHDTQYVSYEDNNSKAIVMKFDGTAWNLVDTSASPGFAEDVSMAIDSKDTPYVGFRDFEVNPPRASVVKYNAPSWDFVGKQGFPASFSPYPMIALDEKDILYIAFSDKTETWKASVMKFDGMNWNYLGASGFSKDTADETRIAVRNDKVYVLYMDYSTSDNWDTNWTVMKYATPEIGHTVIAPIINFLLD